jgi:hypothetical protein
MKSSHWRTDCSYFFFKFVVVSNTNMAAVGTFKMGTVLIEFII